MRIPTLFWIAAGVVTLIGIEILRSVVHRRRVKLYGIGGTQDISLYGSLVLIVMLLCAIASIAYNWAIS